MEFYLKIIARMRLNKHIYTLILNLNSRKLLNKFNMVKIFVLIYQHKQELEILDELPLNSSFAKIIEYLFSVRFN